MKADLGDIEAFLAVARAGGFRDGARKAGVSASGLSEAVRRLEGSLGVRLLNRTTRSVLPTEAGRHLLERLGPALREVQSALESVDGFRGRPTGTLRLNVPFSAARLVLPAILPDFVAAFPEIRLDITAQDEFVDLLAAGCDAGIRYDERLEQDMIAVPIGPRVQRFAVAASPAYLDRRGRPQHPHDLLGHSCIRFRFGSGYRPLWEFERDGEIVRVDPSGPLEVQPGGAMELAIDAAVGGIGIVASFEAWLAPHVATGALEPVLQDWCAEFSGPFLYYPGRRLVPPPLRAFIDFIKARGDGG